MGETPLGVWVRYLDSRGRASGEQQKWFTTKQNWTEMCNVESYSELGKMRLSECRGQTCLNYAEREHLRRSQLGVAMRGVRIAR